MDRITTRCKKCGTLGPHEKFHRAPSLLQQIGTFFAIGLLSAFAHSADDPHLRCLACGHERRLKLHERSILYRGVFVLVTLVALIALVLYLAEVAITP